MTTPTPVSVLPAASQPCWEIHRDGGPHHEEFNPHFDSHSDAEVYLEDLRKQLVDEHDADAPMPALTIDLANPQPCWVACCADCGSKLENDEYGGVNHYTSASDAVQEAEDYGWYRNEDNSDLLRCSECGPWPEPTVAQDRRPGPGQLGLGEPT